MTRRGRPVAIRRVCNRVTASPLITSVASSRLAFRGDRCIGGVHGGSNKASKAIDNRRVIRTEQNLVTTRRGSIGRVGKRETATHELSAREYGVDPGSRSVAAAIF